MLEAMGLTLPGTTIGFALHIHVQDVGRLAAECTMALSNELEKAQCSTVE